MTPIPPIPEDLQGIKAAHYESKRKDYMVPEWNEDSVLDQFEITIQSNDPVELRRQVCASMTAFWQADDAYIESKLRIAKLTAEVERLKRIIGAPRSGTVVDVEGEIAFLEEMEALATRTPPQEGQ